MTKYRFKTEAEFIKEFGDGWNLKIQYGWGSSGSNGEGMDYLFNTPFEVTEDELKKVLGGYKTYIPRRVIGISGTWSIGTWSIGRDMITPMDGTTDTVLICKEESIKVQVQSFYKLNDSLFR